jgi:hypothetical protein
VQPEPRAYPSARMSTARWLLRAGPLRPGHVLQEVGVEGAAGGFLRTFLPVHVAETLGDAGVTAGEAGDRAFGEVAPALRERAHLGIRGVRAGVAVGLHLGRELGPLAFDGRDLVLADLLAPCSSCASCSGV